MAASCAVVTARLRIGVAVVALAAAAIVGVGSTRGGSTAPADHTMVARPLDLADSWFLFDVGATDLDGDGRPDLFTTNHNGRQSVRLGDGHLGFTNDVTTAWGLDQDPSFAGFERDAAPAAMSAPGIYLWKERAVIVVRVVGGPAAIDLRFFAGVTPTDSGAAHTTVTPGHDDAGRPMTAVHLESAGDGEARLKADLRGLPIAVDAGSAAPDTVWVGADAVHPATPRFELHLRDRHAMGWADVDGDGRLDVFIARGGLKNRLDEFPGLVQDELLVRSPDGTFTDVTAGSGITKGICRGRRVEWVDIDGDGDPDLYVTCLGTPSQLWRNDGGLHFTDISASLPVHEVAADAFVWHDIDDDGIPELITAASGSIDVLARTPDGGYEVRQHLPAASASGFSDATWGDLDGDGHADIYFSSPSGSLVLLGRTGGFDAVKPATLGLPATAVNAALVDVDGDGRLDLSAAPGGVYAQRKSGRFAADGVLASAVPRGVGSAILTWFDADGDGDLDAVTAYPRRGDKDWTAQLWENASAKAHWVTIDGGTTAAAPDARVEVKVGAHTITRWFGGAETSRFSQGRPVLTIGLGANATVDAITVTWPGGRVTQLPPTIDSTIHLDAPPPVAGSS